MLLLDDKYGSVKSLKRAFFDVARAKFALLRVEELGPLIEEIDRILKIQGDEPTDADIQFLRGKVYELIPGKSLEACQSFISGVVSCASEDIPAFLNEIINSLNQKNAAGVFSGIDDTLIENLKQRINGNDQGTLIYGFLGKLFLYNGLYQAAIKNYQQIINTFPDSIDAIEGIGQAYILSGKIKEAIEILSDAKDIAGTAYKKAGLSLKLIAALVEIKNFDRAIHEIEQTKTLSSDILTHIQLSILLGHCYCEKREFRLGLIVIEEALTGLVSIKTESNELYIQAVSVKAKLHIALHEYLQALKILEEALAIEQRNLDLIFFKAQVFFEGQFQIEEGKNLISFLGKRKQIVFETKINQILELRYDDGNSYFFAAYIYFLTDPENEKIKNLIEKAESLGLKTENEYPKIGLYLLKGEIAKKNGNTEEAGNNFLEAAKCYYWQNNNSDANKYFQKTISLNPGLNEAYMYYADTLFILSIQDDPPYNNKDLIKKAYDVWLSAPAKIVTSKYDAWHYIVIARIYEALYKFSSQNYYEEYWQSLLYTERALVHDSNNISFWTYLGRFYRNLEIENNGLNAFARAEKLNAEDGFLKEEKVMLQLNMGDYENPGNFLKLLREEEEGSSRVYKPYHESWQGYITFHNYKEFNEAIRLFDVAINEVNNDLFSHQMKMLSLWHAHHLEEAKKEASQIIDLGDRYAYLKDDFTFAWANFIAGDYTKAITILENFNANAKTSTDNLFGLSQFYLYSGQKGEAQKAFDDFILWTYNKRSLYELFQSLDILEFQFKNEKPGVDISINDFGNIIKSWKEQLTLKLENVAKSPPSAEDELKSMLEEYKFENGSIQFIAIYAGLARIAWDNDNLFEAHRIYKSLINEEALFPEVKVALKQVIEEVFTEVRSKIKQSKYVATIEFLRNFEIDNTGELINKYIFLSLAYFGSDNEEKSLENLLACYKLIGNDVDHQKQFWLEITTNAYNPALTWNFGLFFKANLAYSVENNVGAELNQIMVENFWNVLINKKNILYPIVTPVALEISKDLISPEADSSNWYVLNKSIPAMRERIFQAYGIDSPGIRIRGNEDDLSDGTYIIMLDEVPLVMGTVQKDKLFVPKAAENLQSLGVVGEKALHPGSGEDSYWVGPEYKELLNHNNINYLEDYFDYIITHLEAVLVRNLDMFVDIQFCDEYLEIGEDNGDTENLQLLIENAAIIRTEPSFMMAFTGILKGLLREKVPVINKEIIIQAFITGKDTCTDITDLVQCIRIALKKELPVNILEIKSIELPPETEGNIRKELRHERGKTFLAMIPDNCQQALTDIRSIVEKDPLPESLMLLTTDSELRIHIRKLVEIEFPNLIVASREELIKN